MIVKPIFMSDKKASNVLVKVLVEVDKRNMDKSTTIKVLREEMKLKDVEMEHITHEREFTQKNNEVFISVAEDIGDNVIRARPHLEPKVPQTFPSTIHYVGKLVEVVLEDETICMQALEQSEKDEKCEKASVMRKFTSYEGLLQALQEVLKKADQALNIYTVPEVLINIKTLEENNE
ncbi:hypothetical protein KI387_022367, partial [Taxus chinensis]